MELMSMSRITEITAIRMIRKTGVKIINSLRNESDIFMAGLLSMIPVWTLLEIHQVDSDRYFGKASFLLDSLDLGSQHLAGVRQACKDDVVLLRDISEFFLSAVRIRIALLPNLLFSRRRDSCSPTRRHFFSRSMTFVSNS